LSGHALPLGRFRLTFGAVKSNFSGGYPLPLGRFW
jgi:hypothetical protein